MSFWITSDECRDPDCNDHGDAMWCERCESWVEDENADCDGAFDPVSTPEPEGHVFDA